MIDSVQLVLLIVIIILTILLVVLGIQVFLILKELRQSVIKANKILDTAESISENINGPLSALSSLAFGVKASSIITVAKLIKGLIGRDKDSNEHKQRD